MDAPEVPSKFVTDTSVVDIRASVLHIDMDGLHDGQAIKTIISDLQPRQLVCLQSRRDIDADLLDSRPLIERGYPDPHILPVFIFRYQRSLRPVDRRSHHNRIRDPIILLCLG
jgi:hypothetical protein